jgi:tetratricopeptide (TPR) repeat protein
MATRFRTRVGESLATIERYSTPLEATTPSLEALQAHSAGFKAALTGSSVRALALFQRAVAIDPDFALAHAHAGFRYSVMGESALGRQSLLKAYQLRNRASDVERFFIETLYDRDFTGNLERERRTLETWAESYPRDASAHTLLAGLALSSTGQHELAIAETGKAIALDPDLTPAYTNQAFHQLMLNRLDDALRTVRLAAERKLESADLLTQYFVAFLTGNENELRRTVTAARKSPATEDTISHIEALALARSGQLQDARRMAEGAVQIAQKSGRRERAGLFEAGTAVWEAFYGNAAAARQSATRALELGRGGREVDYAAAFALALAGDRPQSRALAEVLAREFPEDTSVQFMYLPTLRALFSLNTPTPDATAAIQALQTASRYDLALGRIGFVGRFGGLYPIYVRGLAYLAARQPAEAAAEFQRIVDHRSIVLVDPIDALARLQLARALVLSGDTAKARSVYDDLFALWENADVGIPLINEARAEHARLR